MKKHSNHKHSNILLIVMTVVIMCGVGFLFLNDFKKEETKVPPTALVKQMLKPDGKSSHVYGGIITTNGNFVIAYNVPPDACVAVSWELLKKGIITINNVTPTRVSAGKLTSLCYMNDTATIQLELR